MKRIVVLLSALLVLGGCAGGDAQEEAEIKQYKDQPLQRDGDRLNPQRD